MDTSLIELKNKVFAYPVVGRHGLGNMLFSWARAQIFCKKYDVKMLAPQWVRLDRTGPILRKEKDKRYYFGIFDAYGYISGFSKYWKLLKYSKISEYEICNLNDLERVSSGKNTIVVFEGMQNFFEPLMGYHHYLHESIMKIICKPLRLLIEEFKQSDFIGVHIRRGDFNVSKGRNPRNKLGNVTPDEWFVTCIRNIRNIIRFPMKCLIFSDGRKEELEFLSKLENVEIMAPQPAIVDILRLARSRFLIASTNSTFSMWAAFWGQMPNIWYPSGKMPILMRDKPEYQILTDIAGNFPPETQKTIELHLKKE